MYIDIYAIRVRPGRVEGFDPAISAESVFRNACFKLIGRQVLLALQEIKTGDRQDQVQKAGLVANRTIAILHRDAIGYLNLEFYCTAVATARIFHVASPVLVIPPGEIAFIAILLVDLFQVPASLVKILCTNLSGDSVPDNLIRGTVEIRHPIVVLKPTAFGDLARIITLSPFDEFTVLDVHVR
jgi:hypothetical protein